MKATRDFAAAIGALLTFLGCAPGDGESVCDLARQYVADCTHSLPAASSPVCTATDGQAAEDVLQLSCEEIQELAAEGKMDWDCPNWLCPWSSDGYLLEGTVYAYGVAGDQSAPATGALVEAYSDDVVVDSTVTGEWGDYALELPIGANLLTVKKNGVLLGRQRFSLPTDRPQHVLDIQLPDDGEYPSELTLSGQILDEDGHPIDGVGVRVMGVVVLSTDAEGRFSAKAPSGSYYVRYGCTVGDTLEREVDLYDANLHVTVMLPPSVCSTGGSY